MLRLPASSGACGDSFFSEMLGYPQRLGSQKDRGKRADRQ